MRSYEAPSSVLSADQARVLGLIEEALPRRARFEDPGATVSRCASASETSPVDDALAPLFERSARHTGGRTMAFDGVGMAVASTTCVVSPMRFPGGSIGMLAVNGAVNDLAAAGARASALSLALVLEEGLETASLRGEAIAIARAASEAGVRVLGNDARVVERGAADGMFICATGFGRPDPRARLGVERMRPGDRIIVSGAVGEHGTAVMLARARLTPGDAVRSDSRSLWPAVDALLDAAGNGLRCVRQASRGGLASTLCGLAREAGVGMVMREAAVPVAPAVASAAEMLGVDPLHMANGAKLVALVAPERARAALAALRACAGSEQGAVIGEVQSDPPGFVLLDTPAGQRFIGKMLGDPLKRSL